MRVPFIVLSYGDFTKAKKLFSYEKEGVNTLPIFTDAACAHRFSKIMNRILREEFKDPRKLQAQLCTSPKMALSMFETVSVYCPDLRQVVIDPSPPARDDECFDASQIQLIENIKDIAEVIEELQDLAAPPAEGSAETSEEGPDAGTNGEPESKIP
jgi:hypothetical protein